MNRGVDSLVQKTSGLYSQGSSVVFPILSTLYQELDQILCYSSSLWRIALEDHGIS